MNLKTTIKILPAILLFVLAFNFINSEIMDQFEGRSECQQTHDYCKLVQAASIKTSSSDFLKLKVEKSFCFHCINKESEHISSYINLDIEQFHSPQKTKQVYLHNRVFLI